MNIKNIRNEKKQAFEEIYQRYIKNAWFDTTPYFSNLTAYRFFIFDILAQNKLVFVKLKDINENFDEISETNKDTEAF